MPALTARLCKAARALLDWTAADLARMAEVSGDTIRSFESERSRYLRGDNEAAVRDAFARAGVRFVETGDTAQGQGVVKIESD